MSLVRGLGDERQRDAVGGGRLREKRFGFGDAANALEPGGALRERRAVRDDVLVERHGSVVGHEQTRIEPPREPLQAIVRDGRAHGDYLTRLEVRKVGVGVRRRERARVAPSLPLVEAQLGERSLERRAAVLVPDHVQLVHDHRAELAQPAFGGEPAQRDARLLDRRHRHGFLAGPRRPRERRALTLARETADRLGAAPVGTVALAVHRREQALQVAHLLVDQRLEREHHERAPGRAPRGAARQRAHEQHVRHQRFASARRRAVHEVRAVAPLVDGGPLPRVHRAGTHAARDEAVHHRGGEAQVLQAQAGGPPDLTRVLFPTDGGVPTSIRRAARFAPGRGGGRGEVRERAQTSRGIINRRSRVVVRAPTRPRSPRGSPRGDGRIDGHVCQRLVQGSLELGVERGRPRRERVLHASFRRPTRVTRLQTCRVDPDASVLHVHGAGSATPQRWSLHFNDSSFEGKPRLRTRRRNRGPKTAAAGWTKS